MNVSINQPLKVFLTEQTISNNPMFLKKLPGLIQKVHAFAFDTIFKELVKIKTAEVPITFQENCSCAVRLHFNLPCKHALSLIPGDIPLSIVARRWPINFYEGDSGKCLALYSRIVINCNNRSCNIIEKVPYSAEKYLTSNRYDVANYEEGSVN